MDLTGSQDAEKQARLLGLEARFDPRQDGTASRGTAIIVHTANMGISRESLTFRGGEDGTITTAEIKTPERTYELACVYLPSNASERTVTINNIIRNKWIHKNTILEADHNMVVDVRRETEGNGQYDNVGSARWFGHLATTGLVDAERDEAGPGPGLFTRGDDKVGPGIRRTRLDKFMMPDARSFHQGWQWKIQHARGVTPFASDHAPLIATLAIPEKQTHGANKFFFIIKELLDEMWFRTKILEIHTDTYEKINTNIAGHGPAWDIFKRRLMQMWTGESATRREQNASEVQKWDRLYRKWIDRNLNLNGRAPQPQQTGELLRDNLKEAKKKFNKEKKRRQQELSTKEFYKKYKIPHGVQWIAEMEITPDWNHPDAKNGSTEAPDEILRQATKYYNWLFSEKQSEKAPADTLLATLDADALDKTSRDKCEGELTEKEVFDTLKNLPRDKAVGPDGVPNEFYKTFGQMIAPQLTQVFNEAHLKGRLSKMTKCGTISLLYKKKARKDVRNYRPITLLNGDYKILTRTLCKRMKSVIGNVVCKENTGFSPRRFIAENTQQMKLMQKYLEENNEDGMFVFLDLEKAFDRVSWDYMKKAVSRMGFGPDFLKWIEILYDPNDPPSRKLRISGQEGEEFHLHCGTAQGCPLSPLLYLCVMEAFTRMIKTEPKVAGIKIGNHTYKLSQFADDTVLLLSTFQSIDAAWDILQIFEKATGQRVNKSKTEGLLLGSLRGSANAPNWIKWCADGDYIISLGVPFGNDFDGSQQEFDFWSKIYHKTKSIMARWGAIFSLTLRGRVMITNSMIYSRFRYWTQVMIMPSEIIDWIETDVHELIWNPDPHFITGQEGQSEKTKIKIKLNTANLAWKQGGIGCLVWTEHLKSLRKLWIRRYLDPGTGD